ncbi:MAG: Xaa-Pro peptidase family protein [Chloroflexota bacterium]|nr:Xaa-Pro peptidase family protein [Chloroflexota bacterium]MDE2948976.1 Xaa-Pro peptidase family protein [Chloroflexota bacterium]
MDANARYDKLYALMRAAGLDVIALIPGPNHRYLTGAVHYVLERPIVTFYTLGQPPIAVIPELEIPLFERHATPAELIAYSDAEGYASAFRSALDRLGARGKTIGVEGLHMRFFEGEIIRASAPEAKLVDATEPLAELRIIKDAGEIALLRRAIDISERALQAMFDQVKVGMSEIEAAAILEDHIKGLGGDGLSFGTILHAGDNTALPHSGPLDYRIQHGDPLIVDFGATYKGYCADITRTVFIGAVSDEQRAFYAVVQEANEAGRRAARPGVSCESVDVAARQVFIDAGYEHLIRHRTGHGLGMEAHEAPYIVIGNKQILEPGMVFTIEPGIYRMGEIGVRIEDNMLISEDGAESLTTFPRDLLIIEA